MSKNPFHNLNPLTLGIKKLLSEMLKGNYSQHEDIIARITSVIITEKDYSEMTKMLIDLYQKGFTQAVESQKEQLEKIGYKVNISGKPQQSHNIFNHQQNVVDNQK